MFLVALDRGTPVDEARTLAVNMLVACEIAYLFSVRMLSSPALTGHALATARPALIATGLVLGLQALFTYAPPVQLLFDTAPLSGAQLLQILGMAVLVLGIVEAEKAVLRRVRGSPAPRSRASAPGA
jgi:magnesium-transporting ATPase (P-type)